MFKKILLLSILGVSLSGCIVAPFHDGYGRGGYDHGHRSDRGDRDYRDRSNWYWNGR